MSNVCLKCGGLVMDPGVSYSWGGSVCYCQEPKDGVHGRPLGQAALLTYKYCEGAKLDTIIAMLSEILNKLKGE